MSSLPVHRSLASRALTGLFDAAAVMLVVGGALLLHAGSIDHLVPLAGAHGGSLAAGVLFINATHGFYESGQRLTATALVMRTVMALILALMLTYAVYSLLPPDFSTRTDLLVLSMAAVSAVVVRRAYATRPGAIPARSRSRTLIFGSGTAAQDVSRTLADADPDVHIVGYYPGPNERHTAVPTELLLSPGRSLVDTARDLGVDEIVVALTERRAGSMPLRELLDCKLRGVRVCDLNSHFEKCLGQIRLDYLNASWLIFGDGFNQGIARTVVKRTFDIVCAGILIVLAMPLMVIAAVGIRLESRGPILYRQDRVGLNNQVFEVVKFRSMRHDAEVDGKPRWASADDDRVTRVGRIMRMTRVDELPQLFSVLRGDMSLVGPRPERPFFVGQLTQGIPFYAVRHSVKPGVTGWAQVRYQYGSTVEDSQEKLQYDLYYVKNHTLMLDLKILLETVHVVLTGKGAR